MHGVVFPNGDAGWNWIGRLAPRHWSKQANRGTNPPSNLHKEIDDETRLYRWSRCDRLSYLDLIQINFRVYGTFNI
jgi:hypothetical protein